MSRHASLLLGLAVLSAPLGCATPEDGDAELAGSSSDALTAVTGFGSNPGGLVMRTYVPSGVPAGAAVVVALHGCAQTADAYVAAGWNQLADLERFYVVYPEQPSSNSGTQCFNWFEPGDTARGRGEALSIKQMVNYMKAHYAIDPARVYVTGLSAGAAMTASLLAAYPDVFSAGAIMAGIPAGCASSTSDAFTCMSGRDLPATTWADRVRAAYPSWTGAWPRVAIWHGTSDYTVRDVNRVQLERQWTSVHGLATAPTRTETVSGATHALFADAAGHTVVESWSIPGMGHGTAVDPGYAPAGGCGTAGAFILDVNLCSTWYAWRFFDGPTRVSAPDAGTTATPDAGTTATPDAGTTATPDAGTTATPDAGTTATPDAGTTATPDAGTTTPDAGCGDATADAGCTCSTPPPPPTCTAYEDSNYGHVVAGRAVRCGVGGSYVCAVGSGTRVGLWTLGMRSTLRQTAPSWFEVGPCP